MIFKGTSSKFIVSSSPTIGGPKPLSYREKIKNSSVEWCDRRSGTWDYISSV